MNASPRRTTVFLTLAGVLPFWFLAIAPETLFGLSTRFVFAAYGSIIGAFLAGTLWGRAQAQSTFEKRTSLMLVASNVLALIAFVTAVFGFSAIALAVQWIVFGLLLVADYGLYADDAERRWYWKLRVTITLMVSLGYVVMLARYASTSGN